MFDLDVIKGGVAYAWEYLLGLQTLFGGLCFIGAF